MSEYTGQIKWVFSAKAKICWSGERNFLCATSNLPMKQTSPSLAFNGHSSKTIRPSVFRLGDRICTPELLGRSQHPWPSQLQWWHSHSRKRRNMVISPDYTLACVVRAFLECLDVQILLTLDSYRSSPQCISVWGQCFAFSFTPRPPLMATL